MFTEYQYFILIINVHVKKKVMLYLSFFWLQFIFLLRVTWVLKGHIRTSLQVRFSSTALSMADISEKLNSGSPALRVLIVR